MLTFLITYLPSEVPLVRRLIEAIESYHPEARRVLVLDSGPFPHELTPDLCLGGLKRPDTIADYSYQRLKAATEGAGSEDWIIQLDPDCVMSRTLTLPKKRVWSGRLIKLHGQRCLHGAAWAMPAEVAQAAIDRNVLTWGDYDHEDNIRWQNGCPVAIEDVGFAKGMANVSDPKQWRNWVEFSGPRQGISHPEKNHHAMPLSQLVAIADWFARQKIKPGRILELGAGRSSLYWTRLIDGDSVRSYDAVEEDPAISTWVMAESPRALGFAIWDCPVVDGFYDLTQFNPPYKFDTLIIDGPDAQAGGDRRLAIEALRPYLAPKCTVVIDDATRPDGQALIRQLPPVERIHRAAIGRI